MSANQPAVFVHTPRDGIVNPHNSKLRSFGHLHTTHIHAYVGYHEDDTCARLHISAPNPAARFEIGTDLASSDLRDLARSLIDAAHHLDTLAGKSQPTTSTVTIKAPEGVHAEVRESSNPSETGVGKVFEIHSRPARAHDDDKTPSRGDRQLNAARNTEINQVSGSPSVRVVDGDSLANGELSQQDVAHDHAPKNTILTGEVAA